MSAEAAFADAVLAHLKGDAGVGAALGGRIHALAPGGTAYPFLTLGRGVSEPAGGGGEDLIDHRLTLRLYAMRDEADRLRKAVSAVRTALHNAGLALAPPWRCVLCQVVYTDQFAAADSRIIQALVRVRGMVEG